MGGPTANIRGLCKGDRIQGRGEVAQAVMEEGGCGEKIGDHDKRYFSSSVGAAATGIWQAWWGRGKRVIFSLW